MRLAASGTVALVAALGLLAACGGEGDEPDLPSTGQAEGDQYVALGDSYTSGPSIGTPTGPAGCEQTDANYPHLLAEQADLELTDASCGGASTLALTEPQPTPEGDVPPQLEAVTAEADLVTLSIGGNDGGTFSKLVGTCVVLARREPQGAPCTELVAADPGALDELFDGITSRITAGLENVRERAPEARVIVVGYPQIFPQEGTCDAIPLTARDYPLGRRVMEGFIEAQEKAADAAGVEFLDLRRPSMGHDICSADPWLAGVLPDPARPAAPYHPYEEQQQAVADLLAERLEQPAP